MKVLITGNKGFIGGHLYNEYVKKNDMVYGWDKDGVYVSANETFAANMLKSDDVEQVLLKLKPDLIIHCAGNADVANSVKYPDVDMESNYYTTHNLLFAMKKMHMTETRFILMSSAAVYGDPIVLPIGEDQNLNPLSPYALHKSAAESVGLYMARNHGIDFKAVRIFSGYGIGLRKQIFWDMYHKVKNSGALEMLGSGYESRDYIYIDDLIQAIMLVAEKAPRDEQIYNVANGVEIQIKEVAEIFGDIMGIDKELITFSGTRREGDPINWRADINKLKQLGYEPKVSFEEGVKRYVEWVSN